VQHVCIRPVYAGCLPTVDPAIYQKLRTAHPPLHSNPSASLVCVKGLHHKVQHGHRLLPPPLLLLLLTAAGYSTCCCFAS
jgi:hypothetical protein